MGRTLGGRSGWLIKLEGTTFAMPFFIFQGAHDVITPPAAAKRFFDDVSAPVKDSALIADASHFASFRPDRFLNLMPTKVRPAITSPSSQLATEGLQQIT
jgi:proline iminopeptidase